MTWFVKESHSARSDVRVVSDSCDVPCPHMHDTGSKCMSVHIPHRVIVLCKAYSLAPKLCMVDKWPTESILFGHYPGAINGYLQVRATPWVFGIMCRWISVMKTCYQYVYNAS